ncbi:hypothetical protein V491_01128, partial [Pseudogymnoascus sp. VKM F-3775]
MRIRRRGDGARVTRALERGEDGALTHRVPVRAALCSQEGEARGAAAGEGDGHGDGVAIAP